MRIKKARVLTLTLTIILFRMITLLIIYYPKSPEQVKNEVVNKVLENNLVKTFSERFNEAYNITLITKDELVELKNSDNYVLYVDLPDADVYRVLVEEGGNGYLVFLDAQTFEELKIIGAHNLVLT